MLPTIVVIPGGACQVVTLVRNRPKNEWYYFMKRLKRTISNTKRTVVKLVAKIAKLGLA